MSAPDGEEGRLELDCAHATVSQPLAVAEDGHFEWRGTWFSEGGGPTAEGPGGARKVRLRGRIDGEAMTLVVETMDGKETLGTFTLRRNGAARIRKCG